VPERANACQKTHNFRGIHAWHAVARVFDNTNGIRERVIKDEELNISKCKCHKIGPRATACQTNHAEVCSLAPREKRIGDT